MWQPGWEGSLGENLGRLLSRVQLFAAPWTAAHQASLSFTMPWNLLRFMCIESMMLSNHLQLTTGGEWIHIYVWLSPFTIHRKLSQRYLLISHTLK